MPARRRDFQGALCGFLPLHIGQTGASRWCCIQLRRFWRAQNLHALEVIEQRGKIRCREHFNLPGPGGFPALNSGADQSQFACRGTKRCRQYTRHGHDRAIKRQFAERREARQFIARQHIHRGEYGKRNRQIEMAAFLGDISRCQIHQHALGRHGKAKAKQGRAHPFAAFGHRLIGQAHHQKGRQAGGDLHLHLDRLGFDPSEGEGGDAGNGHAASMAHSRQKYNHKLYHVSRHTRCVADVGGC